MGLGGMIYLQRSYRRTTQMEITMPQSLTFTTYVSVDTINKVNRLVNAALNDPLTELMQNTRRIDTTTIGYNPILGDVICMEDYGPSLEGPHSLFALSQSSWSDDILHAEGGVGMGFFILANRGAKIVPLDKGACGSWIVQVSPEAFSGNQPIIAEKSPNDHRGISITFSRIGRENLAAVTRHAARHSPLPLFLNGKKLKR